MPQASQTNMKATSPSKLIQRGIDQDWGAQQKDTTTAQAAIAQKYTDKPVDVNGTK